MTAGILTVLGLMPGMPLLPCWLLAGGLMFLARRSSGSVAAASLAAGGQVAPVDAQKRSPAEEVEAALGLDVLALEVGYELVGTVDASRGGTLLDRVAMLRQQMARDLGIVVPPVHVRAVEPTFGMPATWIAARDKELAEALGYTVVDHATVIATHLGELLRTNAHKLIGRQEVQHLLDLLARTAPKLIDDVVPNLLSLGDVVRVMRNLVREGVSVRDTRTILESLAELSAQTKDPEQLTELVRERLASHITSRLRGGDGTVTALALDPRRYVRAIFERKLPNVVVASFREVDGTVPLRIVERLGIS